MFRIQSKQRTALRIDQIRQFENRLCMHIRGNFPTMQVVAATEFEFLVHMAVDMAIQHGITIENDVRRFVEHFVHRGQTFFASSSVVVALTNPELTGTAKMDLIDELEAFWELPCHRD